MANAAAIKKMFSGFRHIHVAIIGDIMVDKYVYGNVDRISPEAPVPVLDVKQKETRPGGAANVAVNIKALDATPYLFSVIGNDSEGDNLISLLKLKGINTKHILRSEKRITTAKTRIIAKNHQMMRIDEEDISDLDESLSKKLLQSILKFLQNTPPDVCIFEDYDKGVLSPEMISKIMHTCNQLNIPVIVDPKKKNFFAYQHCTVFKPNIREINESLHTSLQYVDLTSLNNITTLLHQQLTHKITLITLGDKGIYLRAGKKSSIQKAHVRNVADVSGAGDTVVSVAALCLAAGAEPSQMAAIANIAGGLVCESPGVVSIDKAQLLQECIDLL
jgi:rfaE bifunctional protein kinase chain/domain